LTQSVHVAVVQIGRMTLAQQYEHFQNTKKQIAELIGQQGADELINNAIYSFTTGGNDWVNNYYAYTTTTKQKYTTKVFGNLLISTFRDELKVRIKFPHRCCHF